MHIYIDIDIDIRVCVGYTKGARKRWGFLETSVDNALEVSHLLLHLNQGALKSCGDFGSPTWEFPKIGGPNIVS